MKHQTWKLSVLFNEGHQMQCFALALCYNCEIHLKSAFLLSFFTITTLQPQLNQRGWKNDGTFCQTTRPFLAFNWLSHLSKKGTGSGALKFSCCAHRWSPQKGRGCLGRQHPHSGEWGRLTFFLLRSAIWRGRNSGDAAMIYFCRL